MRKCSILMLAVLLLTYGYRGFRDMYLFINDDVKVKTSGRLSDIAIQSLPVRLETPDSGVFRQVKHVQKDGNHLFMIADSRLLQYDISGKFIRQLAITAAHEGGTEHEALWIANYTLDTDLHQVIAVDSQRNIRKYDYAGNCLATFRLHQFWSQMTGLLYHKGSLWITAENIEANDDVQTRYQIVHRLYRFDAGMNEISHQPLFFADVGRDRVPCSYIVDELLADEYGVYAYASPIDMDLLLSDTLAVVLRQDLPRLSKSGNIGQACIYPVRKGKRHLIATNYQAVDNLYAFCYDKVSHTAYVLSDGFKDDFHQTGYVSDLQSLDAQNESYCYIKSGAALGQQFPGSENEASCPILFIVTLKS